MKIISAIPGTPSMNKEEVEKFLESKLLLRIGTVDDDGDPKGLPRRGLVYKRGWKAIIHSSIRLLVD